MKTRLASKRDCTGFSPGSPGCFGSLTGAAAARFQRDMTQHVFLRGQSMFQAGGPAHVLYLIASGRVKVVTLGKHGEEVVLRLLGPGEILGYRPLLANEPYSASAEVVEDATLCMVPAATLRELLREAPGLAELLLAKLARELRLSEELMMDVLHRPAKERVARLLLTLLDDNLGAAHPDTIASSHLRRKDMARMAGTTPETLSRILRGWSERRVVEVTRDRVRVRDRVQLERIAH